MHAYTDAGTWLSLSTLVITITAHTHTHTNTHTHTGTWLSLSTLVITIIDARDAGPPPISEFTLRSLSSGELRNVPPACAPSTALSGTLLGDFGPSTIEITSIRAEDPNKNSMTTDTTYSVNDTITITFNQVTHTCTYIHTCMHTYSVNDTITITFNQVTNLAGFSVDTYIRTYIHTYKHTYQVTNLAGFSVGTQLTKAQVDSIFAFSDSLGANYVGRWLSRSVFVITAVDVTGAGPPRIGSFTLRVKLEANSECMYVCMYICMYVFMYVCMYVCVLHGKVALAFGGCHHCGGCDWGWAA
jgi:hypothetical protein